MPVTSQCSSAPLVGAGLVWCAAGLKPWLKALRAAKSTFVDSDGAATRQVNSTEAVVSIQGSQSRWTSAYQTEHRREAHVAQRLHPVSEGRLRGGAFSRGFNPTASRPSA